MKFIGFLLSLLTVCHASAQGLNGEIGINRNIVQSAKGIATIDEFSYLLQDYYTDTSLNGIYLDKIDTNLEIVWTKFVSPTFHFNDYDLPTDYNVVFELKGKENEGVFMHGYGAGNGDLWLASFFYLQKVNLDGGIDWIVKWSDFSNPYLEASTDVSFEGSNIYTNLYNDTSNFSTAIFDSKIFSINAINGVMDSLSVQLDSLKHIHTSSTFQFIAARNSSLIGFDLNGLQQQELIFPSKINEVLKSNDTLIVFTSAAIYSILDNLSPIDTLELGANFVHTSIKEFADGNIRFLSESSGSNLSRITLNHNLQIVENLPLVINHEVGSFMDFSNSHLSVGTNVNLPGAQSIRYLDYSFLDVENDSDVASDISIIDIDVYNTTVTTTSNQNVYDVTMEAQILVKNLGMDTISNFYVNHIMAQVFDGIYAYFEQFNNIEILPGDSIWLDLGEVHNLNHYLVDSNGDYLASLCIYTSNPNEMVDSDISNDQLCKTVILGHVGLEELSSNQDKKLVRIVDLMGRETSIKTNELLVYQFSDGSSSKVFIAE